MLPNIDNNSELTAQYQADPIGFLKNQLDEVLKIMAVSRTWQIFICAKSGDIDLDRILLGVHEKPSSNGFTDRFSVKGFRNYSFSSQEKAAVWEHACKHAAEKPDTIIPILVLLLADPKKITEPAIINSLAAVAATATAPKQEENFNMHNAYALRMLPLLKAYLDLPQEEQKLTSEQRSQWREKLAAIVTSPAGNLTSGTHQLGLANQLTLPMITLAPQVKDHILIEIEGKNTLSFSWNLVDPIAAWVKAGFEFEDQNEKGEICLRLFQLIMPNAVHDFSNNANAKSSGRLFDTYNALTEYGALSIKSWHCNQELTLTDNMRFVKKYAASLAKTPDTLQPIFKALVNFTLATKAVAPEIRIAVGALIAANPAVKALWTKTLQTQLQKIGQDQAAEEQTVTSKTAQAVQELKKRKSSSLKDIATQAAAKTAMIEELRLVRA